MYGMLMCESDGKKFYTNGILVQRLPYYVKVEQIFIM
jgi:hypothetical protein